MRRNLISEGTRSSLRRGVTESVIRRKRSVQASRPSGTRQATKTATLIHRISKISSCECRGQRPTTNSQRLLLEVLLQIHPRIKACHLVVAIEHQRGTFEE